MLKSIFRRAPERYRILAILVSTSCIGVILIMVAVYNASSELEVIHEIENMYRFAAAQSDAEEPGMAYYERLRSLPARDYRVLAVRGGEVLADSHAGADGGWRYGPAELEPSRVNEEGGYIRTGERILTWVKLPAAGDGTSLIMMHRFSTAGPGALVHVYTRRILVPALFYIWLMVWTGYIVRYLTHKLSEQKEEMERMALHDTLTGLPNRNLLDDRLQKMLEVAEREQSKPTIVMMDLDGFKKVNDTHGHAVGDALLKEVAARLKHCVRPGDTVCRLGGDEFILLLDDARDDSSIEICKRIAAEVSKPVVIQGKEIDIGFSMGAVRYSDYHESPDDLIHKADQAMYEIKSKGGGILMHDAPSVSGNESSARLHIVA